MNNLKQIETAINNVKNWNQEAGNELHAQFHHAQNSNWSRSDLAEYMKSESDVAEKYYSDEDNQHREIREIQDSIINFFGS